MKIRKATSNDLEQLMVCGKSLLKQHAALDPYFTLSEHAESIYQQFLESCFDSDDKILLVAQGDTEIKGYAVAEIQKRSDIFLIKQNGYINNVFIDTRFRKQGIARELLRALKVWFESKSIEYIELSVLAENTIAKKTWSSFGFNAFEIKKRVKMEDFV